MHFMSELLHWVPEVSRDGYSEPQRQLREVKVPMSVKSVETPDALMK